MDSKYQAGPAEGSKQLDVDLIPVTTTYMAGTEHGTDYDDDDDGIGSTNDDRLNALRNIHNKFNTSLKHSDPSDGETQLRKAEKTDPSEKLQDKLKLYETCDGSVDEKTIEELRKDYLSGFKFNARQSALEMLQNPLVDENKVQVDRFDSSMVPVEEGAIGDIRSVFMDAISSADDRAIHQEELTDEQWVNGISESKLRKMFAFASPYLKSRTDDDDDGQSEVMGQIKIAFKSISSGKGQGQGDADVSDKVWFQNLTEDRVQSIVEMVKEYVPNKYETSMWHSVNLAFNDCATYLRSVYKKPVDAQKTTHIEIPQNQGLTKSKIEQILANSVKEFQRENKGVDQEVMVMGMTKKLKECIQEEMADLTKLTKRQVATTSAPEKLSSERLESILNEFSKEFVKTGNVDQVISEGLASKIRKQIIEEMTKDTTIVRAVSSIDIAPGVATTAKEKLLSKKPDEPKAIQPTPAVLDQERLDKFSKATSESTTPQRIWEPDVPVQVGLAQNRLKEFLNSQESASTSDDWKPDVLISSGIIKERTAALDTLKQPEEPGAWTSDVPVQVGIAKENMAKLLAASNSTETRSSSWKPDVPLESGMVGERAGTFTGKPIASIHREWKPDIELASGLAKERIQKLYEDVEKSKEIVTSESPETQPGITKERLSDISKKSTAEYSQNQWQPDIEMKKGLTKERTSMFHNLESAKLQPAVSEERPKIPLGANGKRIVVEVENDPLPLDPSIARANFSSEKAQIEEGYTKMLIGKLANAYEMDTQRAKSQKGFDDIWKEMSMDSGNARSLKMKFADYQQDAKAIKTTSEKSSFVPRRFVDTPAPEPIRCDGLTAERCSVCRKPMCSTEGFRLDDSQLFVHKRCMPTS